MSHTASKRARLTAVLAMPIDHYRDWVLTVACPKCPGRKQVQIGPLIRAGRQTEPVSEFIARLVCSTCRYPPSFVRLQSRPEVAPPGSPPIREIILLGPGAY